MKKILRMDLPHREELPDPKRHISKVVPRSPDKASSKALLLNSSKLLRPM